jgi:large subunit ribosomal protein L18
MNKKETRLRRSRKTRLKIAELGVKRLTVFKSNCNIYAQIIDESGSKVLASASTLTKGISTSIENGGNVDAASKVGKLIAEKAISLGIKQVAFDRAGFKYHGRIKALAESAREVGLEF